MGIAEQRPGDSQGHTILIVDDNPANLEVIGEYLLNAGLRIMTTRTGETGLKLARQDQPDLILLDVMLPGIDGFETCRRLKADERTQAIPIMFLTVITRTEDKIKGFAVGSVDYIAKPFQQEEVLARIQMHLLLRRLQTNLEAQVQERTLELEEANTRLKAEIAEREQAEVALRKINRMFRILSDCNQAVIHSTEETALLPEICRIIADRGGYPFVWVGLAEQQDAATMRPVAYAGHETDFLTTVIQTWTDSEQHWEPTSTAMRSGDLCLVSTIQADPHFEL